MKTHLLCCLFVISVFVVYAHAETFFNDGGFHTIDYVINDGVHVLSNTQIEVVPGGEITQWLQTNGSSSAIISGGIVDGIVSSSDNSHITISSGHLGADCRAFNNGTIDFSGGVISGNFRSDHYGSITYSGGLLLGDIYAGGSIKSDYSTIQIIGSNFAIGGVPVSFGSYFAADYPSGHLTGMLQDGTLLDHDFLIYDESRIVLSIPEPSSIILIGIGALSIFRKQFV